MCFDFFFISHFRSLRKVKLETFKFQKSFVNLQDYTLFKIEGRKRDGI